MIELLHPLIEVLIELWVAGIITYLLLKHFDFWLDRDLEILGVLLLPLFPIFGIIEMISNL